MSEIKKINTDNFRIENNIIFFNDSLIQVSNISQVSIAPVPKKKFNFLSILIMVVGILLVQSYSEIQKYIGIGFLIAGIAYVFYFLCSNKDEKYLNISLNSGNVYCIFCKDVKFFDRVMYVIEYCINNHYTQCVTIDFNNCRISDSPVTVGSWNKVRKCQ